MRARRRAFSIASRTTAWRYYGSHWYRSLTRAIFQDYIGSEAFRWHGGHTQAWYAPNRRRIEEQIAEWGLLFEEVSE